MTTQDWVLAIMVLGLVMGLVYHVIDDLKHRKHCPKARRKRK